MVAKRGRATKAAKTSARARAAKTEVDLQVDAALKCAWEKARQTLETAEREGMLAWDRKYELVGEIIDHQPPLYLGGGMATARDFIAKHLPGEDERSVRRNVRTARYASPDEEAKYGTSKIDAAIDYLEALFGRPAKGRIPVDFAKLRIDGKLFADSTAEEIKSATRAVARSSSGAAPKATASPIVKAIVRCLPKDAKDVTVHYAESGNIAAPRTTSSTRRVALPRRARCARRARHPRRRARPSATTRGDRP